MSILSVVSKILEKAVYVQFEAHLIENNIIYEYQSGFSSSFSTETCLRPKKSQLDGTIITCESPVTLL